SVSGGASTGGGKHGGALGHSADRTGTPPALWFAANRRRIAAPWHGGQPQTGGAADAGGQSVGRPAADVRDHNGFGPRVGSIFERGQPDEAHRHQPALGGRYHLHPVEGRVRLPGGDFGRVLAEGGGLGAGADFGNSANAESSGAGNCGEATAARVGSPLGSRF